MTSRLQDSQSFDDFDSSGSNFVDLDNSSAESSSPARVIINLSFASTPGITRANSQRTIRSRRASRIPRSLSDRHTLSLLAAVGVAPDFENSLTSLGEASNNDKPGRSMSQRQLGARGERPSYVQHSSSSRSLGHNSVSSQGGAK